jgi:hypothetical protein
MQSPNRKRRRLSSASTVGAHPQRPEIEAALARGTPLRTIARRYGVSTYAACRHRKRMRDEQPEVFAALVASTWKVTPEDLERLRVETSDGWLNQLRAQHAKLVAAQDQLFEAGNHSIASQVAAQVLKILEVIGRAVGEIGAHVNTVNNNIITMSGDYWKVRTTLIQALAPYPEAKADVLAALRAVEGAGREDTGTTLTLPTIAPGATVQEAAHG